MLSKLSMRDYRCFQSAELELHPRMNIFTGRNAQGKTSLLEAACVLMRLQSPRTSTRSEWLRFEAASCLIEGTIGEVSLRYTQTSTARRLAVDGAVCKTNEEYLKNTSLVVWMDHADMNLARGGSEHRRRFLDFAAAQIFPDYRESLRAYERALRSRNFVLKRDAVIQWKQADAYALLMARHATVLRRCREELVEAMIPHTMAAHRELSGGGETANLKFESGFADADLASALREARADEERTRQTAAGPHRDDVALFVNERDASSFASEGQQRTLSIALKIAQARVLEERSGYAPLLLLDDVFGELDKARRQALLRALPRDSQVFITTTFLDWMEATPVDGWCFEVEAGSVERTERSSSSD